MKISIAPGGVFADGAKINNVTRVDVINLNPIEDMEVVLHIAASEIEVDHKRLGFAGCVPKQSAEMTVLSDIKTCDLVNELMCREGVTDFNIDPYIEKHFSARGPATVLMVTD